MSTPSLSTDSPRFGEAGVDTPKVKSARNRYFVAAILILLAIGLGLWVWPTTTALDDTSDWKTYRNEKYGLEFKYPNNLVVSNFSSFTSLYVYFDADQEEGRKACTPFCLFVSAITNGSTEAKFSCLDYQPVVYETNAGSWNLFPVLHKPGNVGSDYIDGNIYQAACIIKDQYLYRFRLASNSFDIKHFSSDLQPMFKRILGSVKFI
jgi:hypothetical protein